MGRKEVLEAIELKSPKSIPQWQELAHPGFVNKISGIDPYEDPESAFVIACRKAGLDFVIGYPGKDSLKFAEGESAKFNEDGTIFTEWGVVGSLWKREIIQEIKTVEDVFEFDIREHDKRTVDQIAEEFQANLDRNRRLAGNDALIPGWYYNTMFMWPLLAFDWELFLVSAMTDPDKFKVVLDRFEEHSIKHTEAFAKTDVEVIMSHDDIALQNGLVFRREWYHENIFPRYHNVWKPLKDANKKIFFLTDGDFSDVLGDIVEIGVDGLVINSEVMDFESIVKKYGRSHVLFSNIDTKIVTFGTSEEIENEIRRVTELADICPGMILHIGGDLPQNIPIENIEVFFDLISKYRHRK